MEYVPDNYDMFKRRQRMMERWLNLGDTDNEKLNGPGYSEIGTDNFVPEEDAFDYALERCLHGTEEDQRKFREMLVEWFYSGNWVKED